MNQFHDEKYNEQKSDRQLCKKKKKEQTCLVAVYLVDIQKIIIYILFKIYPRIHHAIFQRIKIDFTLCPEIIKIYSSYRDHF